MQNPEQGYFNRDPSSRTKIRQNAQAPLDVNEKYKQILETLAQLSNYDRFHWGFSLASAAFRVHLEQIMGSAPSHDEPSLSHAHGF